MPDFKELIYNWSSFNSESEVFDFEQLLHGIDINCLSHRAAGFTCVTIGNTCPLAVIFIELFISKFNRLIDFQLI